MALGLLLGCVQNFASGEKQVRIFRIAKLPPHKFETQSSEMAHHKLLLRIIGFQRRQASDPLMSNAKALKKAQRESVRTTIRKRRILFAGVVLWTGDERLTRRVMFGTMTGRENPGPG